MNTKDSEILATIQNSDCIIQREIASETGYSLGFVNKSIRRLQSDDFLTTQKKITEKALNLGEEPKKAVILAAGLGIRMVPITTEIPKALIRINGETIIERQIKYLRAVGISDITIIVGFMKEKFEYLIDKFSVKLIVNKDYRTCNTLTSLSLITDGLSKTYIVPGDIWCIKNPFRKFEFNSWYMITKQKDKHSTVKLRNGNLIINRSDNPTEGNKMIGICYISSKDSNRIYNSIQKLSSYPFFEKSFWEEALYIKDRMIIPARIFSADAIKEITTYEDLMNIDSNANELQKTETMKIICNTLNVTYKDISDIKLLKKGMTNRSFTFSCKGKKYIMRIPGEGTDKLINRKNEKSVYDVINPQNISDHVIYFNADNGYKITEYIENARTCNPNSDNDVKSAMLFLRSFHEKSFSVNHEFDVFLQIDFYESLFDGKSSYEDYHKTKKDILSLQAFIERYSKKKTLCHIDSVPDNFLFYQSGNHQEIKLIDWEYSGMADPLIDIAMFCIYSLYDETGIEKTIDAYFSEGTSKITRTLIYCYIATCGLLWSNWCEYKHLLGVEFGEYSLYQYRYAKKYYVIAKEKIAKIMEEGL